jgi:MEMO1 family protein
LQTPPENVYKFRVMSAVLDQASEPSGVRAVRQPAVAGTFYPADAGLCQAQARAFLQNNRGKTDLTALLGGLVPHAGWICSGAVAGRTIASLAAARPDANLLVVFAAVHTPLPLSIAAMDSFDAWQEPGAASAVAGEIRRDLAGQTQWFGVDDRFHQREHAVEVVLPLIQAAWPHSAILPVEVPLIQNAMEIGRQTARRVIAAGQRAIYLASSDLTHYGPAYRFAPAGVGPAGIAWAMENDRRLLRVVTDMTPERIVPEVSARGNACGGGAIAAMMAACLEHGAKACNVLGHTNSFDVLSLRAPQRPDNAVGYAAIVVG